MMLALLLLGAVVLRDDVSRIPPHHKWRYDRFVVTEKNLPVDVNCQYQVQSGDNVRVELMTGENLEALRAGQNYETLQASTGGALHHELGLPGTFAIVIWNDDDTRPAEVALKLSLDFSAKNLNQPRTLTPQRQFTVILVSLLSFLSILTVSARQLLKAMAERPKPRLTSFQIPDAPESILPKPDHAPD
jgi:hypothetical protein